MEAGKRSFPLLLVLLVMDLHTWATLALILSPTLFGIYFFILYFLMIFLEL
jgi:hypothetical protein